MAGKENPGKTSNGVSTTSLQELHLEPTTGQLETADGSSGFDTLILVILVGCIGIAANSFAIVVICSQRKMRRRPVSQLIVNQSALDLMVSVVSVVYRTLLMKWHFEAPYGGIEGELYCRLWFNGAPLWGLLMSSTYNLLAVTMERYLMIVHPIYHKIAFTARKTTVLLVATWLLGPLFTMPWGISFSGRDGRFCLPYAAWPNYLAKAAYGIITLIVNFLLPTVLLIVMYGRMVGALGRSTSTAKVAPSGESNKARAHRNLIKTLVIVVACFVACNISNNIFYAMFNLWQIDVGTDLHFATILLVYINCCVNPFVYIFKFREFQAAAKSLFVCQKDATKQASCTNESSL